jgi:hypothetical protein
MKPEDLTVEFWPASGFSDPRSRIDAWRQLHHAAQGLVELGKSWGEPRADDAHSALVWSEEDAGWISTGTGDQGPVIGWLDFGGGSIWVERPEPQEGAWIELDGRTVDDIFSWVRSSAERLSGSAARHDAVPAPDLPAHAVADGAPFDLGDTEARADLEALYEGCGLLLTRIRESLGERHNAGGDDATPRLWPHHFDAASLFVVARDDAGSMTRTIGVGLTPPDGVDDTGYWYVSPWARGGVADAGAGPDLPVGRWEAREGTLPMAVLPLSAVPSPQDPEAQMDAVASFVANAFAACETWLA